MSDNRESVGYRSAAAHHEQIRKPAVHRLNPEAYCIHRHVNVFVKAT